MLAVARICKTQNCETFPKEGFVLRDESSKNKVSQSKMCTCLNCVSKWPIYRCFTSFSTLFFFTTPFHCIIFKLSALNPRNIFFHFLEQLNKLLLIIIVVIHQCSEIFWLYASLHTETCYEQMRNDPLWYLYDTNTWHLQEFLHLKH